MALDVSGTPRTTAEIAGLIDKIDLIVLSVLSDESTDAGATFRLGDRQVNRTEYLRWLLEARQHYVQQLMRMPVWEETVLQPQARS